MKVPIRLPLILSEIVLTPSLRAADRGIELRDYPSRGFPPDVIHYTFPAAGAELTPGALPAIPGRPGSTWFCWNI